MGTLRAQGCHGDTVGGVRVLWDNPWGHGQPQGCHGATMGTEGCHGATRGIDGCHGATMVTDGCHGDTVRTPGTGLTFSHVDGEGAFGDLGTGIGDTDGVWPLQDGPVGAAVDVVPFVFQHHLHRVPPALGVHDHHPHIARAGPCHHKDTGSVPPSHAMAIAPEPSSHAMAMP